mgnify:CR=1 FL=1
MLKKLRWKDIFKNNTRVLHSIFKDEEKIKKIKKIIESNHNFIVRSFDDISLTVRNPHIINDRIPVIRFFITTSIGLREFILISDDQNKCLSLIETPCFRKDSITEVIESEELTRIINDENCL